MIKKLIIIVALLMFVPMVLASAPEFSYENRLATNVTNGENDFGDILFFHEGFTPEEFVMNEVVYNRFQRYDVLRWQGNFPVRVVRGAVEVTLFQGDTYTFEQSGQHILRRHDNASIQSELDVDEADDLNIILEEISIPTGFDIEPDKTNFLLPISGSDRVNFTANVDNNVRKGEYTIRFSINGEEKQHTFNVLENINWTMNTTNLTKSVEAKSGETIYLGRIEVNNVGNEDIQLITRRSGDGQHLISVPQPQPLRILSTVYVDITAQIPTIQRTGNYSVLLNLTAGGLTEEVELNITVIDNIPPVVESVNFSSDRVNVPNDITVVATDNVDVERVVMEYDDTEVELVKDGNLFITQVTFTKLSEYVFDFCAFDSENNSGCKQVNKTFETVNVIHNFSTSHTMPSKRYGVFSNIFLFNLTEDVPEGVSVSIVDLNTNSNSSVLVRVVDSNGNVRRLSEFESVSLISKDEYFLEVRADSVSDVEGILRVELPQHYSQVQDMTFRVSFKDYDVPNDFNIDWVDGRKLDCKVVDTGDLSTSYYDCSINYPIGVRPSDISIPTTVEERSKLAAQVESATEEIDNNRRRSAWFISILLGSLVILSLISLFMIYWYPFINLQTGSTNEYNDDKR